jgi:hypothetical protein
MASTLILPDGTRPTNLHLNSETDKARHVTADMYHIAERIGEINPNLFILELERETQEGSKFGFAIMEHCQDGVDRLVFRAAKAGTKEKDGIGLDGRVLERLRYIMSVPLHERIAICDRDREKWEKEQQEKASEELYERMGGLMHIELERTGFIQRPVSYAPMNRTARRHGRRMAR